MTPKQEAAMRQALEALEFMDSNYISLPQQGMEAITALREALAEQTPKKFDPNESFRKEEANLARVREFMRSH